MSRAPLIIGAVLVAVAVALIVGRDDVDQVITEVTLPLRHDDIIRQQAEEKDLDPALIAAVINAESGFSSGARSDADARGLMQVTPATAQAIADKSGGVEFELGDLSDPDINIRYGTYHLRELLDAYGDNLVAALAAYNAGSGNVDEWGGSLLELGDIRFEETRAYVEQVLDEQEQYRANYAEDLGL